MDYTQVYLKGYIPCMYVKEDPCVMNVQQVSLPITDVMQVKQLYNRLWLGYTLRT